MGLTLWQMDEEIVGRTAELEVVERFAARLSSGPRGLAIQGEAGIGKTALWLRAVAVAGASGAQVLQARPASPEVRVSFSALVDLFERVPDALLGELPPPQRTALEVALYRVQASGDPESSIVGVALLHAIRLLAADRPLVIAVDEAQWLDRPSRTALEYAVRRLRDERVGVLAAERVSADTPAGEDLPSFLDPNGVDRLVLGPIPVGALHHLVRTRLGLSLPRPTLLWVHDQAAGNPFYALELARAWGSSMVLGERQARGVAPPSVPSSLHDLLRRRIDILPDRTRDLLLIAALSTHPTLEILASAADASEGSVAETLEPARAAGVIEIAEGGALRIAHPLLAATIAGAAPVARRRAAHRRLAELAADPEEHARHLAAGADAPDLAIARELVTAADLASTRGAIAAAVDLLDQAERLWPTADRAGRQRLLLLRAERIFLSGDTMRAHRELDELLRLVEDPTTRLEAEILVATVIMYDGNGRDACRLMEDALTRAPDAATRARIHARLAWMYEHDLEAAAHHSRTAVSLIDPDADPGTYAFGLMNAAALELQLGRGADGAAIARGHELQERSRVWDFSSLPANWSKWMDDFDRSRELNERYLERARQMGDESSIAQLLGYLVELECWTGQMDRATSLADEAVDAAEQTEQPSYLSAALARRALVRAYRGHLHDARADASRALELGEQIASELLEGLALSVLAFIEMSAGNVAAAATAADRALEIVDGTGSRDHVMLRFHADQIEAHIALGDLPLATALLERHEARNKVAPRPWLLVTGLRCRALLAAASGDVAGGLVLADRAVEALDALAMPLEAGRTWQVAGQLRRRAGRRRDAATALASAEAIFDGLGAAVWLDRTRREIASLGLSRGAADELTPSEERVAGLAAGGLTNREVAARLLISPKTVEATLARAYQKLGIRRRAELGARLGPRGP